jgi:GT2 family glycosyltransferase
MTESRPQVDVVVLTWNDGEEAEVAVRSALASSGVDARVWVVDNGSDRPFPAVAGATVHRSPENLGVSKGRRLGVTLGDAPLICFLDSDAVLAPGALASMAAVLADDSIALVGPVFDGVEATETGGVHPTLVRKLARAAGLTRTYRSGPAPVAGVRDVDFVIGACQVFRRDVYGEVGGLSDEGLFGPEDVELCRRFRAGGHRVVQADGVGVEHDARRGWRNPFNKRGVEHLRSVLRYYVRRPAA